jgi:hypothetical protein
MSKRQQGLRVHWFHDRIKAGGFPNAGHQQILLQTSPVAGFQFH